MAAGCSYVRWLEGWEGERLGNREVARVETGRPFRRLLLYSDEGVFRVKH